MTVAKSHSFIVLSADPDAKKAGADIFHAKESTASTCLSGFAYKATRQQALIYPMTEELRTS